MIKLILAIAVGYLLARLVDVAIRQYRQKQTLIVNMQDDSAEIVDPTNPLDNIDLS